MNSLHRNLTGRVLVVTCYCPAGKRNMKLSARLGMLKGRREKRNCAGILS